MNKHKNTEKILADPNQDILLNEKDIFLDTDDESRDSLDMNLVVSFEMERKYAMTMES